ncbi:efflux RND transporter periplasmic adaptor subunit [Rhodoferax sp. PAMC 29310]|uniref:efflux RND transporter periplasmic adaptor subunit n=1 Tax=Rhodoferax sp. PAMC 29310 TaxID=2822760 RepID=UPI001B32E6D1|nr:efflux RND transporter periplasmic adaptor subunit [Rhodoferax sp. PAMC 29310]
MKLRVKWVVIGLVAALLVAGAVRTLSSRQAQKAALQAQQTAQKTRVPVVLNPDDLVQAASLELSQGLAISGPLRAVNSAMVKARIAGELQGLTVREGDFVKAGQIIARIDPTESQARVRQAQQQAESAKAQVNLAQRSFDNNNSLVSQGFISKTALESSATTLAGAQANFQAAQAAVDVATKSQGDTVLRAPIAGQVAQRLAQPGERLSIDARIIEIVDLSALELEAPLNAADAMAVKVGQTAQLRIEGAADTTSARVVRINPSAAAGSRAVLAYLALAPTANLRQGLFAQGTLVTGQTTALALALNAVRTDKPQPYVQLVVTNQVAHQPVTLGQRGEFQGQAMVEIAGVSPGAVVIRGAVGALREGTPVTLAAGAK